MLAQVASDGEAAAPGERPVREGGVRVTSLDLDGAPDLEDLVGQLKPQLLEARDRAKAGVAEHERPRGSSHRGTLAPAIRPAMGRYERFVARDERRRPDHSG